YRCMDLRGCVGIRHVGALCKIAYSMPHGLARLRLDAATKIIKVDVLNYALQTGAGVNTTTVTPTELLAQQNKIIAACHRRRSGLPRAITNSTSVPFNRDDVLLLIRPSTLQLRVVNYQLICTWLKSLLPSAAKRPRAGALPPSQPSRSSGAGHGGEPVTRVDGSASESGNMALSSSSEDENIRDIQHLHRPLGKRRRVDHEDTGSDEGISSDQDERACSWDRKNRGVVFLPSPADRRAHGAIAQPLHAGKEIQMLLQSAQQSEYVDFIATSPVPRGAYCFGFGVGISIMHFRRVLTADEVAATESGMDRFARYFYNKTTRKFIGTARDFIISYADSAPTDPSMARLLVHWVNTEFGKFCSCLVTKGLPSALRIRKEFSRNDEKLGAQKEAHPSWKLTTTVNGSHRGVSGTKFDSRRHGKEKIPLSVIESLPKSDDGRRLCPGADCSVTECARAHFKPASLSDETKAVLLQPCKGLSEECKDL
ncbi:hypothetical protein F442_18323, partial [Phytophthora nicotianae P10297]